MELKLPTHKVLQTLLLLVSTFHPPHPKASPSAWNLLCPGSSSSRLNHTLLKVGEGLPPSSHQAKPPPYVPGAVERNPQQAITLIISFPFKSPPRRQYAWRGLCPAQDRPTQSWVRTAPALEHTSLPIRTVVAHFKMGRRPPPPHPWGVTRAVHRVSEGCQALAGPENASQASVAQHPDCLATSAQLRRGSPRI